jgi:cyclomaltodextrinase
MKKFGLVLIVIIAFQIKAFPQHITDLIKPLHLIAGVADSILISDIYYSDEYNPIFLPNKNIRIEYDNSSKILVVQSDNRFEGFGIIDFQENGALYAIPFYSEIVQNHTFELKLKDHPDRVNLFASFNGWNRENLPMIYDKKNKAYSVTVLLEPGSYEYKFYVQGDEFIDPVNPDSIPNGLGGFNSVLTIPNPHPEKSYLFINSYEKTRDRMTVSFSYSNNKYREPVKRDEIIALYNDTRVAPERISTAANKFLITIDSSKFKGENVLRVVVNRNGLPSNLQTLMFFNGKPAGSDKHRTDYDNIIYAIMVDRFKDGDPSNSIPVVNPHLTKKANYYGGDLQGIIDKIDEGYFDSLSVNALWLSPVVDNTDSAYQEYPKPHRYYTGYHGYWPISSTRVEERFGNMDLMKKLVKDAHKHGIHILIDYIANHVHEEHPFFKEHRDWFGHLRLPDGRLNLRLWDEHRLTTWFEPYLPSFDYEGSKEALDTMTSNAVWWLQVTNADGFRHDAVKHVPNEFWRTLTRKIKSEIVIPEHRDIFQIGETFGSYSLVNSYVNNGQLDAQFNFNLYDTAIPVFIDSTRSFKSLDEQMQKSFSVYGVNSLMGNIMDSHDKVRFMAYADGDISLNAGDAAKIGWENPPHVDHESSYKKLELYLSYLSTIPGIPVIDYGDEIGMTGAADPDNRRMMRFNSELTDWEKHTLQDVRTLVKIRKENSALRYGDFYTLQADKNIYAFIRSDLNERVLVVLNKNNSPVNVSFELPYALKADSVSDLIFGTDLAVENYKVNIQMEPYGYSIFKLKENSPKAE